MTVLSVEVSSDLRSATAFVSLMGTEAEQKLAMKGLQHACGFLQAKVAARLQTRTTPVLRFQRDEGVKKSIEISKLIDEAMASDREARKAREAASSAGSPTPDEGPEADPEAEPAPDASPPPG